MSKKKKEEDDCCVFDECPRCGNNIINGECIYGCLKDMFKNDDFPGHRGG